MTTSKNSTQLRFEDEYKSFQVASPASLLVQQESGEGHPTIDISGRKCLGLFEKFAPPGSWQRTFAVSLVGMKGWFSTRCALIWKVKATKSSRPFFQLQASTRRTAETEFGLLPTVTTQEAETPCELTASGRRVSGNDSRSLNVGRMAAMEMLPTPVAWDGNGGGARKPKDGKANALGYSLTIKDRAAAQMLPTPMAQEHDKITGKENQDSLTKRARQQTGKTSQLSPLFVEEMMGFPKGWTVSPFQSGDEKA
jgi:hypothetical protein